MLSVKVVRIIAFPYFIFSVCRQRENLRRRASSLPPPYNTCSTLPPYCHKKRGPREGVTWVYDFAIWVAWEQATRANASFCCCSSTVGRDFVLAGGRELHPQHYELGANRTVADVSQVCFSIFRFFQLFSFFRLVLSGRWGGGGSRFFGIVSSLFCRTAHGGGIL